MVRTGYIGSVLVALLVSFSNASFAGGKDLMRKADALFETRGESQSAIHEAKSLYLKVIKDKHEASDMRRVALDRYSRLAVFEGEVAKENFRVKDAAKIFKDCIDVTDNLSSKKIQDAPVEFVYWRSMCIGLWAANASKTEVVMNMGRIKEMDTLIEHGQKQHRSFDGYGFNRMLAGKYVRSKALTVLNLYQPALSLDYIEEAIAHGCDNYMNYILKAEALEALGRPALAVQALEFGIAELKSKIENNRVPSDLIAENIVFLSKMYRHLEKLSS